MKNSIKNTLTIIIYVMLIAIYAMAIISDRVDSFEFIPLITMIFVVINFTIYSSVYFFSLFLCGKSYKEEEKMSENGMMFFLCCNSLMLAVVTAFLITLF